MTIPAGFAELEHALVNPIMASAADNDVTEGVYGVMQQFFVTKAAAFSYLLFVLLYVPCVSTVAVMAREINRFWTIFSVVWSTAIAYGLAVMFYQFATFAEHPAMSLRWSAAVVAVFLASMIFMRLKAGEVKHAA